MKWSLLAKLLLPVLAIAVPGATPVIPWIAQGIDEADTLFTDGADKKAHVLNLVADGAAAVSATGKVQVDPVSAQVVTQAVFQAIDSVNAVVKANQPAVPPA